MLRIVCFLKIKDTENQKYVKLLSNRPESLSPLPLTRNAAHFLITLFLRKNVSLKWPRRNPDFTALDISMWRYGKAIICAEKVYELCRLGDRIYVPDELDRTWYKTEHDSGACRPAEFWHRNLITCRKILTTFSME